MKAWTYLACSEPAHIGLLHGVFFERRHRTKPDALGLGTLHHGDANLPVRACQPSRGSCDKVRAVPQKALASVVATDCRVA
jgi:hypothetical protein